MSEQLIIAMANALEQAVGTFEGPTPSILVGRGRREIAEICARVAAKQSPPEAAPDPQTIADLTARIIELERVSHPPFDFTSLVRRINERLDALESSVLVNVP